MFAYFKKLESIPGIANLDVSKVSNMYYMFYQTGQNAQTFELDLSSWNTSNATDMCGLFCYSGYKASRWDIGKLTNWDVSKVLDMASMFDGAVVYSNYFDIGDLTNWDTRNVTNMHAMFYQAGMNATTWNSIGTLDVRSSDLDGFFYNVPRAKATLNIYENPTTYNNAFTNTATNSNSEIIINYKSSVTNIDNLIATKSSNSHVYKSLEILD